MNQEKLRTWEQVVTDLMEESPVLRGDDNLLYEEVLRVCEERTNLPIRSMSLKCYLETFGALRMEFNIPTMETISRVRRKAQKNNPHLKPKDKIETSRQETQLEFEEYAVG